MMTRMMVMIVMIAILITTIINIIILIVIFVSHFAKTFFYMMIVFSSFRKSKTFVLYIIIIFVYVSRTLNDYFSMYFYDEEITVIFLYLMVTYFLGSKRCFEVEYIYTRLYATL